MLRVFAAEVPNRVLLEPAFPFFIIDILTKSLLQFAVFEHCLNALSVDNLAALHNDCAILSKAVLGKGRSALVLLALKNAVFDELLHLLRLSTRDLRGIKLLDHSLLLLDIFLCHVSEESIGIASAFVLFSVLEDVLAESVEVFLGDNNGLLENDVLHRLNARRSGDGALIVVKGLLALDLLEEASQTTRVAHSLPRSDIFVIVIKGNRLTILHLRGFQVFVGNTHSLLGVKIVFDSVGYSRGFEPVFVIKVVHKEVDLRVVTLALDRNGKNKVSKVVDFLLSLEGVDFGITQSELFLGKTPLSSNSNKVFVLILSLDHLHLFHFTHVHLNLSIVSSLIETMLTRELELNGESRVLSCS